MFARRCPYLHSPPVASSAPALLDSDLGYLRRNDDQSTCPTARVSAQRHRDRRHRCRAAGPERPRPAWTQRPRPCVAPGAAATVRCSRRPTSATACSRIALPEGFSYRSFSLAGTMMSDGHRVPLAHDGMGVFNMRERQVPPRAQSRRPQRARRGLGGDRRGQVVRHQGRRRHDHARDQPVHPRARAPLAQPQRHDRELRGRHHTVAVVDHVRGNQCRAAPAGWLKQHGYCFDVPAGADSLVPAVADSGDGSLLTRSRHRRPEHAHRLRDRGQQRRWRVERILSVHPEREGRSDAGRTPADAQRSSATSSTTPGTARPSARRFRSPGWTSRIRTRRAQPRRRSSIRDARLAARASVASKVAGGATAPSTSRTRAAGRPASARSGSSVGRIGHTADADVDLRVEVRPSWTSRTTSRCPRRARCCSAKTAAANSICGA